MTAPERAAAALAARQHGVVTRRQLLDLPVSPSWIDRQCRSGRLRRLHRGVYLIGALHGGLEPPRARVMAAVLACGPGGVVSHVTALALHGLVSKEPARAPVHVSMAGTDGGRRPGIRPHRVPALAPSDWQRIEGVPVTTPVRTLLDVAGAVPARTLERAYAQAARDGRATPEAIEAALVRRGPVPGAGRLRRLASASTPPAFTRSEAEERLLEWIGRAGLPPPETNVRVGGLELDCVWRAFRVAVEVDGFAFHGSRRSFEADRHRDARLASLGYRVVRITWRQLDLEPVATVTRIAQVLAVAASEGRVRGA